MYHCIQGGGGMEQEVYDFGLRLKRLRNKQKLTQSEVADRLGVKVLTIKKYESNEQLPPVDKLESLALMYRTSLDYLRNFDKREPLYIDDLTQSRQRLILEVIDSVRNEQSRSEAGD